MRALARTLDHGRDLIREVTRELANARELARDHTGDRTRF
jgi:hypothetical protein